MDSIVISTKIWISSLWWKILRTGNQWVPRFRENWYHSKGPQTVSLTCRQSHWTKTLCLFQYAVVRVVRTVNLAIRAQSFSEANRSYACWYRWRAPCRSAETRPLARVTSLLYAFFSASLRLELFMRPRLPISTDDSHRCHWLIYSTFFFYHNWFNSGTVMCLYHCRKVHRFF